MDRRRFLKAAGATATAGLAAVTGYTVVANTILDSAAKDTTKPNTIKMVSDGDVFYFDPIGLHVEPGETVRWVVMNDAHSATAYGHGATPRRIPDDAEAFDSTVLEQDGATYRHTFDVAGTYDYFCIPHKDLGMVGRIIVGEPGGPAEKSRIPDGSVPASDAIVKRGTISYADFSQ